MCPGGHHAHLRISAAFPAKPLQPPVTCFRRKRICSTITAIESPLCRRFHGRVTDETCPGFSPDSLVQKQGCVSGPCRGRVAHLPQKPDSYSVRGREAHPSRCPGLAACLRQRPSSCGVCLAAEHFLLSLLYNSLSEMQGVSEKFPKFPSTSFCRTLGGDGNFPIPAPLLVLTKKSAGGKMRRS